MWLKLPVVKSKQHKTIAKAQTVIKNNH